VAKKFQKTASNLLALALLGVQMAMPANLMASKKDDAQIVGQLTANGEVTVNGKKAITGSTVFNDSRVTVNCASGHNAIVNLGRLGRIQLSPGTQMVVRFTEGLISGELLSGKALVNNVVGVKVSITTPEGLSASDGKEAAALAVSTQKGTRCVPMVAKSGSNSGRSSAGGAALGAGGLAAVIAGAGGAAIATGVALGNKTTTFDTSLTLP
jgi:hypothetical protein